MRCIPVNSLTDPRLAAYANLRDAELRHRQDFSEPVIRASGAFMAEGELVVRRLVRSTFPVESVLVTPARLETVRDALEELPDGTPVYIASQEMMNAVVGFNIHRGLLAVGLRANERSFDAVVAGSRVLLILEDLVDHDNLGSIFRNTAALVGPGAGVLLSPRCADPLYRKSLRVSVGHVLGVPFARVPEWPGGLAAVKAAGFRVLALSPAAGSSAVHDVEVRLREAPAPPRLALVLGTEGAGLSAAAGAMADERVRIPMASGVDSLNVAVAAAVALHRLAGPSGAALG